MPHRSYILQKRPRQSIPQFFRLLVWFGVATCAVTGLLTATGIFTWNDVRTQSPDENLPQSDGHVSVRLANFLKAKEPAPKLALIIDDFGVQRDTVTLFMGLELPLTLAILPKMKFSEQIAERAHQNGYEILLHLPMEPHNAVVNNPGDSAVRTYMTDAQIRQRVSEAADAIPHLIGVNNHMGSKATEDVKVMQTVMGELKRRNLFFIDSLTSPKSVAYRAAQNAQVPTARNQIFIDNKKDVDYIKQQIRLLAKVATRRGAAIGIGHAHPKTARAILESLPMLQEKGIELVFVSELVR